MKAHLQTMARYNRWMNERLYECSARLSDEERKEDVGAFLKSIHGTLNHPLLADRLWMGRFTRAPFTAASLDAELYASFEALRRERSATDHAIVQWVETLTEEDLAGTLTYTSMVNPAPRSQPLGSRGNDPLPAAAIPPVTVGRLRAKRYNSSL